MTFALKQFTDYLANNLHQTSMTFTALGKLRAVLICTNNRSLAGATEFMHQYEILLHGRRLHCEFLSEKRKCKHLWSTTCPIMVFL